MTRMKHIRKVTPTNFANWLKKYTETYQHGLTEHGQKVILRRANTQEESRGQPSRVVITGIQFIYKDGKYQPSDLDVEYISFALIPLDNDRTEITAECTEVVLVLAYFENELMPEIERLWPAEGRPVQQPAKTASQVGWRDIRDFVRVLWDTEQHTIPASIESLHTQVLVQDSRTVTLKDYKDHKPEKRYFLAVGENMQAELTAFPLALEEIVIRLLPPMGSDPNAPNMSDLIDFLGGIFYRAIFYGSVQAPRPATSGVDTNRVLTVQEQADEVETFLNFLSKKEFDYQRKQIGDKVVFDIRKQNLFFGSWTVEPNKCGPTQGDSQEWHNVTWMIWSELARVFGEAWKGPRPDLNAIWAAQAAATTNTNAERQNKNNEIGTKPINPQSNGESQSNLRKHEREAIIKAVLEATKKRSGLTPRWEDVLTQLSFTDYSTEGEKTPSIPTLRKKIRLMWGNETALQEIRVAGIEEVFRALAERIRKK